MIYDYIPYPLSSGAPIRNYNLLKHIAREHEVWMVAFARRDQDADNIAHLREICAGVEVVEMPQTGPLDRPWLALKYLLKGWPIELRHYYSQELADRITTLTAQIEFNLVEFANSIVAPSLEALPQALQKNTLVTCHDVIFSKAERITRLEPRLPRKLRMWLYANALRHWEPAYLERFGRCIAVSASDRQLLLSRNPRLQIDVIPNGIDTHQFQPLPQAECKPVLLFVGNMEYRPNIDAVTYFYSKILPLVKAKIPHVELDIVGLNPAAEVLALAGNGVNVTGKVDDVRPYYYRSAVCIVPLRAGGGTRLKILEAMALGRPVVSTSVGCEGLDLQDGEHLFIADTPETFADRAVTLIKDTDTRNHIVHHGRQLAEQKYDWDVIAAQLLKSYREVAR